MSKIYLAGKIEKNCWRHALVPGLREWAYREGPIISNGFTYVGPFFSGCDHGCFHRPNSHGVASTATCRDERPITSKQVIHRSHKCIDASDVVIGYVNAPDCYGTIAEIQYAVMLGKEVIIAFAPNIASDTYNDFWFIAEQAHRVEFNVTENDLARLVDEL